MVFWPFIGIIFTAHTVCGGQLTSNKIKLKIVIRFDYL